jgi:hypothetical protein
MRVHTYIRIAPTTRGYRVAASIREPTGPITDSYGNALPTVVFRAAFILPSTAFAVPSIGDVDVPLEVLSPLLELEPTP